MKVRIRGVMGKWYDEVYLSTGGNPAFIRLDPKPSQQVFNHSPDGFSWGYSGSGPAQLALAVLLAASDGDERYALDNYQAFKRRVIAPLPQSDFEIEAELPVRKEEAS